MVQEEKEGKYYLQKPSVQFGSNEGWTASNIITAVGAIMIKFVYVTQEGQNTFQVMINANSSEFYSLPAGSEVLKDIRIQVTQSGGA